VRKEKLWIHIHWRKIVKTYDLKTQTYKLIQQKNLPVRIESDNYSWKVVADKNVFLHEFNSKDKAILFCRELGFQITAYITPKETESLFDL
jgi:hypothetical protein